MYGLPWRKEKLRSEIPKAELGLAYLGAEDLLSRMKLWAREKGRLADHRKDRARDQVPVGTEVDRIDGALHN